METFNHLINIPLLMMASCRRREVCESWSKGTDNKETKELVRAGPGVDGRAARSGVCGETAAGSRDGTKGEGRCSNYIERVALISHTLRHTRLTPRHAPRCGLETILRFVTYIDTLS